MNVLLLGCLLGGLLPLSATEAVSSERTITIFVSIMPQAFFIEQIAGTRGSVQVLVKPGQSPHVFEPTPQHIVLLRKAELYFTVGLPFEKKLIEKIHTVAPQLLWIDTSAGIPLRRYDGCEEHAPGDDGNADPHIWLSPMLIKKQAETIADALCRYDPVGCLIYRDNFERFHAKLDALDAQIREKLSPFKGQEVFVFHPAFGYFTDAYGLRQVAIESEGKEPGARSLAQIVARARNKRIQVIFADRQFSTKSADAVARQIGADVIVLDPLAKDCFENLRSIADLFAAALSKSNTQ
ncbi:MAG: zinc ABC transporter substrate-binding protein [Desulfobacterota bacterium]|nr:zinc ABC transporter substrate-binding protein [Thermodesulfobacteriota bacterium]